MIQVTLKAVEIVQQKHLDSSFHSMYIVLLQLLEQRCLLGKKYYSVREIHADQGQIRPIQKCNVSPLFFKLGRSKRSSSKGRQIVFRAKVSSPVAFQLGRESER